MIGASQSTSQITVTLIARDNDGRVDGYVYNGQYYNGAPQGAAPAPTYTPPARSGERG